MTFFPSARWLAFILCAPVACDCAGWTRSCVDAVEGDAVEGDAANAAVPKPKVAAVASTSTSLFMMSSWGDAKQSVSLCFRSKSNDKACAGTRDRCHQIG